MKTSNTKNILVSILLLSFACADNELDVTPNDRGFPMQIMLGADEGGDLADAEDYDIEVTFADFIGDLPTSSITLTYEITELEDDMNGSVRIDKIIYEYEDDDCVYERTLNFTTSSDGLSGTIEVSPDVDLGTVPESFEIVLTLPGEANTEGSFVFELKSVETSANVILGPVTSFKYEVLDNDLAGEWKLDIETEEQFEVFKTIFGPLNSAIEELSFDAITGNIALEFEFGEMKIEIELVEEEEVTVCEDGKTETEIKNKVLEFESDYEAEEGALVLEGSYQIFGNDGEAEDELDFIIEANYETVGEGVLNLFFTRVIDEDNFKSGEEFFISNEGTQPLKIIKD